MPEPKSHYASNESVRIYAHEKKVEPLETPVIEKDPLVAFEHFHGQMQADLRNWVTFEKDDRLRRVALFASPVVADAKAALGRDEFKWSPRRRHKVLNYIIWIESIHPLGNRDVAAAAFNAIFPKKTTGLTVIEPQEVILEPKG